MQKILILSLFLISSCGCPPDEKMGEVGLSEEAANCLPYNSDDVLMFANEDNEFIQFTLPRGEEIRNDQLCYRTICTEAKFNSPSTCEYYDAESRRYSFFSDDNTIVLDLVVYSDVYDYGTAEFYDALQVGFSFGTPSIVGYHIIKARFSTPLQLSELSITDFFEEEESLDLNGEVFTDVLVYEEASLGIYLQKDVGLIAFKNADHTWVIQ